jgi:hypothetical protein
MSSAFRCLDPSAGKPLILSEKEVWEVYCHKKMVDMCVCVREGGLVVLSHHSTHRNCPNPKLKATWQVKGTKLQKQKGIGHEFRVAYFALIKTNPDPGKRRGSIFPVWLDEVGFF